MTPVANDGVILGRELLASGQAEKAGRVALDVLRADSGSLEAYLLLADAEERKGRLEHAALALQQAASRDPDNAEVWAKLGAVYALRAHWSESARAHARAAECAPQQERHLAALAIAQLAAQQYTAAVETGKQLQARFSETAVAHLVLGHILKVGGKLAEASVAYQRAVQLDPNCSNAVFNLVDLKTPESMSDPVSRRVEAMSARADLSDADRMEIEFALARIHESLGSFDTAFEHYRKANEARQRDMRAHGLVYKPELAEQRLLETTRRFGAAPIQSAIEPLPIDLRPVFIVGMPRSGTSLVEQILSCHPEVSAGGELSAAQLCYSTYLAERARQQLPAEFDPKHPSEQELLHRARERYIECLFALGLDAAVVTDKFPGNFQILGFLRAMFPAAVIVHCTRNPVATCWSLYAANLSAHAPYKTSLENLGHFYGLYRHLMNYWTQLLRPAAVEVSYEALVESPEVEIRRLLAACELPWHEECMKFYASTRPVTTASLRQVRQPIYVSSVGHWRNYERHLGALARLGGTNGSIPVR